MGLGMAFNRMVKKRILVCEGKEVHRRFGCVGLRLLEEKVLHSE
jgi:hypothetical protein